MSIERVTQFYHLSNQDFHSSPEVQDVVNYLNKSGADISTEPRDKIADYLELLESEQYGNDGIMNGNHDSIDRQVQHAISKSFEASESVRNEQTDCLTDWVSYLNNPEDSYPGWFKNYVFSSVIELATSDDDNSIQQRNAETSTSDFPALNKEAVKSVFDVINDNLGSLNSNSTESNQDSNMPLKFKLLYEEAVINSIEQITVSEEAIKRKNLMKNVLNDFKTMKKMSNSDIWSQLESVLDDLSEESLSAQKNFFNFYKSNLARFIKVCKDEPQYIDLFVHKILDKGGSEYILSIYNKYDSAIEDTLSADVLADALVNDGHINKIITHKYYELGIKTPKIELIKKALEIGGDNFAGLDQIDRNYQYKDVFANGDISMTELKGALLQYPKASILLRRIHDQVDWNPEEINTALKNFIEVEYSGAVKTTFNHFMKYGDHKKIAEILCENGYASLVASRYPMFKQGKVNNDLLIQGLVKENNIQALKKFTDKPMREILAEVSPESSFEFLLMQNPKDAVTLAIDVNSETVNINECLKMMTTAIDDIERFVENKHRHMQHFLTGLSTYSSQSTQRYRKSKDDLESELFERKIYKEALEIMQSTDDSDEQHHILTQARKKIIEKEKKYLVQEYDENNVFAEKNKDQINDTMNDLLKKEDTKTIKKYLGAIPPETLNYKKSVRMIKALLDKDEMSKDVIGELIRITDIELLCGTLVMLGGPEIIEKNLSTIISKSNPKKVADTLLECNCSYIVENDSRLRVYSNLDDDYLSKLDDIDLTDIEFGLLNDADFPISHE